MAAALNLRRHLWPLLVAAVLLPAVGIAYLGAAAYGDERGAVAARLRTQARVAAQLAEAVRLALTEALRRVEAGADGDGLARHGFVIVRTCPQAVHGFGRQSQQATIGQALGRLLDGIGLRLGIQQAHGGRHITKG